MPYYTPRPFADAISMNSLRKLAYEVMEHFHDEVDGRGAYHHSGICYLFKNFILLRHD